MQQDMVVQSFVSLVQVLSVKVAPTGTSTFTHTIKAMFWLRTAYLELLCICPAICELASGLFKSTRLLMHRAPLHHETTSA